MNYTISEPLNYTFAFTFVGFCCCYCSYFETMFLCVVLDIPELSLYTRLAWSSERSTCLCLLLAGIEGIYHHA